MRKSAWARRSPPTKKTLTRRLDLLRARRPARCPRVEAIEATSEAMCSTQSAACSTVWMGLRVTPVRTTARTLAGGGVVGRSPRSRRSSRRCRGDGATARHPMMQHRLGAGRGIPAMSIALRSPSCIRRDCGLDHLRGPGRALRGSGSTSSLRAEALWAMSWTRSATAATQQPSQYTSARRTRVVRFSRRIARSFLRPVPGELTAEHLVGVDRDLRGARRGR